MLCRKSGSGAVQRGYRLNTEGWSKRMLRKGGKRQLPEFILRNCYAVSPPFHDLVERFEPSVHQFFPVDI